MSTPAAGSLLFMTSLAASNAGIREEEFEAFWEDLYNQPMTYNYYELLRYARYWLEFGDVNEH